MEERQASPENNPETSGAKEKQKGVDTAGQGPDIRNPFYAGRVSGDCAVGGEVTFGDKAKKNAGEKCLRLYP